MKKSDRQEELAKYKRMVAELHRSGMDKAKAAELVTSGYCLDEAMAKELKEATNERLDH